MAVSAHPRVALLVGALAVAVCSASCHHVDAIARAAAGSVPASNDALVSQSSIVGDDGSVSTDLPPEQVDPGFDFQPLDPADDGSLQYRIRINSGGSPALVALTRLTPLFNVDGKDGPAYVSDAFFADNPQRTPGTIQPGDRFVLKLPANSFVVRSIDEHEEGFGGRAKVREYVSERGDRLRYYLTYPFPITYELDDVSKDGVGTVHLSSDLAYLLSTRQTDAARLAQAIYRVTDPDIFQTERIRALIASVAPGQESTIEVDRTHTYMDPVRDELQNATGQEQVSDPSRSYLTRYTFDPSSPSPFIAVEDALGTATTVTQMQSGRVFRIEYDRDGTVRVLYRTGADDGRGKRDPAALREDDRWAAIYAAAGASDNPPVKWGPGQPSDLDPFPTARDPQQRAPDVQSYDFLIPGRTLVLTFTPTKMLSDQQSEQEFRSTLKQVQDQFKGGLDQTSKLIEGIDSPRRAPAESDPGIADTDDQAGG